MTDATGTWSHMAPLRVGRIGAAALRLADGRVLVSGGCAEDEPDIAAFDSTEIWDPASECWTTTGALQVARWEHAACATRHGAMVFGGLGDTSRTTPAFAVERYGLSDDGTEGVADAWMRSETAVPPLVQAVLQLSDGRVLVVGSPTSTGSPLSPPQLVLWGQEGPRAFPPAPIEMMGTAALTLADGSLALVGGHRARHATEPDAVRWDPRSGAWSSGSRMIRPRFRPTATLLRDGSVLVVGGYDYDRNCTVAEVERWDPETDTFSSRGKLAQARTSHTAMLLDDGRVLIVGGHRRDEKGRGGPLADVTFFDPETETLTSGPPLSGPRRGHHAIALGDGSVMVVGGGTSRGANGDVERWCG